MRNSTNLSKVIVISILSIFILSVSISALDITVGLQLHEAGTYEGYTLFSPNSYTATYLIDNNGQKVHSWDVGNVTKMSVYLREDGLLLKGTLDGQEYGMDGAGVGGRIQLIDWDGTIVWDYLHADSGYRHHHDIEPMPNGNILILAWEKHSVAEAIAAGRDSTLLTDGEIWSEQIIEVEPVGFDSANIVWEWHAWDHLIQEYDSTKSNFGIVYDHPELIHLNFPATEQNPGRADWLHFNAVAYNPDLDQILVSSNRLSEIMLIDHSTTTAEAAGHTGGTTGKGGDILYRWGNPEAYQHGDSTHRQLYGTHNGQWIPAGYPGEGNLILYNNGRGRPDGNYSSIEELTPPIGVNGTYLKVLDEPYSPDLADWTYISTVPTDFYSSRISGMQRLPNGNTLICSGLDGSFFEVTSTGETIWSYINPVTSEGPTTQGEQLPSTNEVFKVIRYSADYPGLTGKDLTPDGFVEIYPPCCVANRGNVDNDAADAVDIADLVFFVSYSFGGSGIAPECSEEADVDGSNSLDIADIVYLVNYMFNAGPLPLLCP